MTTALLDTSPGREGVSVADRTIKVLHVLWSGELAGAERAVYQLVRAQMAHDSTEPAVMFARSRGPHVDLARSLGCDVRVLELANNRDVGRLREIARRMEGFDVHHFHSAEPLLMAASSRVPGAARVYTHRGGMYDYPAGKRLRFELCGMLLRRSFHAFSGNTAHGARSGAALYRMHPNRFRVTYNGIDFSLIEPARPAGEITAELAIGESDHVLGTAAVLKDWKRIDRLIRAVGSLQMPGLHLVVVGDGPERERLEALVRSVGAGAPVHFVGRQERPWDYFQVMDAFSLPSMGLESFGNAAVEAMGLGLPTIVFADGGGLLEHIQHGQTGLVVETQSELERAISQLMENPEMRREIGRNARASVRQRYSSRRAANAYHALYMEALQEASVRET